MIDPRLVVVEPGGRDALPSLARDVARGLAARPKSLPCVHFYDAVGSKLFDQITATKAYYLSRAELSILSRHADEIVGEFDGGTTLVELGSGSSTKTRVVIEALLRHQPSLHYAALDVSRPALLGAARGLLRDYPSVRVTAIVADYPAGLEWLARQSWGHKLVLYLGSSIGNFDGDGARRLLADTRAALGDADRLAVGVDLPKKRTVLEAAYNDDEGLTARFNLNLLRRINEELGGHFDLEAFEHQAFYNEAQRKIEMHLVSLREQEVRVEALDRTFAFSRTESIHTEDSYKYRVDELATLAAAAGLREERAWHDPRGYFADVVFVRAE